MTGLDRFEGRPGARDGYWPSAWPAECGGNRRQKAAAGRLDAGAGTASLTTRYEAWVLRNSIQPRAGTPARRRLRISLVQSFMMPIRAIRPKLPPPS